MDTLQGDIDKFVNDEEKWFSDATRKSYGYTLGRLASWLEEGGKRFETLSVADVKNWILGQGWSPNLAYAASVTIRSFAVWMHGRSHPLARLRIRKPDFSPQRTLTKEQAGQLLGHFANMPKSPCRGAAAVRNRAMISLMLDTGLRASEICRLQLPRLDLESRELSVLGKGSRGGKWRHCVFTEQAARTLRDWFAIREQYARSGDRLVFVSVNGKTKGARMTPGGLRAIFRKIGKLAGLPGFSPHDLRRSMATIGIQNGAPSRLIQKQGGWESLDLLERYTQGLQAHDVDAYLPGNCLSVVREESDMSFFVIEPAEPRSPEVEAVLLDMQDALQGLGGGQGRVVVRRHSLILTNDETA